MIAAGQGGEALDVDAEESGEGVGLGIAKGRELGRYVLDRAMTLAHLNPDAVAAPNGASARRIPIAAEGRDEDGSALAWVVAGGIYFVGVATLERCEPLRSEGVDGVVTARLSEEADRLGRQVVVPGRQVLMALIGDDPLAGRPTPSALAAPGRAGGDQPARREVIEMAPDPWGAQTQGIREGFSGDRSALTDRGDHPVAGSRVRAIGAGLGRNNHTSMLRNYQPNPKEGSHHGRSLLASTHSSGPPSSSSVGVTWRKTEGILTFGGAIESSPKMRRRGIRVRTPRGAVRM